MLASFQGRFGVEGAWRLANAPWILDLENWENFAKEVRVVCGDEVADAMPLVVLQAEEVVFAVVRLVLMQEAAELSLDTTDDQKIEQLAATGWVIRRAAAWEENDCLIDALAQVLEHVGIIAGAGAGGSLTPDERREACAAARRHLLSRPALHPRDPYGRPRWDAYLQHHRHAEALIWWLKDHSAAGPQCMPRAGLTLVVHARYDTDAIPAEWTNLCDGEVGPAGARLELHLFNWTGGGLEGYHYDALVRSGPGAGVGSASASVPERGAAASRLKRLPRDGKGRAGSRRPAVIDVSSPEPEERAASDSAVKTDAPARPKAKAKGKSMGRQLASAPSRAGSPRRQP